MNMEDHSPMESNIPIPITERNAIWEKFGVGDSKFFADQNHDGSLVSSSRRYAKRAGKKFTARLVDGGLRIWRIK